MRIAKEGQRPIITAVYISIGWLLVGQWQGIDDNLTNSSLNHSPDCKPRAIHGSTCLDSVRGNLSSTECSDKYANNTAGEKYSDR